MRPIVFLEVLKLLRVKWSHLFGRLAQLGEHQICILGVRSSILLASTMRFCEVN